MQRTTIQKLTIVLVLGFCSNIAVAQDSDLEKFAKGGDTLFWIWAIVVSIIALVLFASLLFSKKKEYTK